MQFGSITGDIKKKFGRMNRLKYNAFKTYIPAADNSPE